MTEGPTGRTQSAAPAAGTAANDRPPTPAVPPAGAGAAAGTPATTAPARDGVSRRAGWIALAIFFAALLLSHAVYSMESLSTWPQWLASLVQPVLVAVLVLAGLWWVYRIGPGRAATEVGLRAPFVLAVLFALTATLPMAIGFGVGDEPVDGKPLWEMLFILTFWPFAEELLFRGYAFRQLHRRAGWGFWSATLVPTILFGVVHVLYFFFQDAPLRIPLAAAGTTILLGVLYAWLFKAWGDNLWVPIAFHGMLNFWWEGFGFDRLNIDYWGMQVLRAAAIALAIMLTLMRHRLPFVSRRVTGLEGPYAADAAP
ncbi:MAG TPA: CPBP family intramembrane glutamic endopeptidase [Thermoanaerobaculia bacterium]|nr:CPBP family intramembrane glutamic endopeptidase [Thermoanaerobaculia bacterium]